MKSGSQNPSPVSTRPQFSAQALYDDLRLIHRVETANVAGFGPVDVCATCRPPVEAGYPTDDPRYTATSGRELYPCPTLRIARRHARLGGAR